MVYNNIQRSASEQIRHINFKVCPATTDGIYITTWYCQIQILEHRQIFSRTIVGNDYSYMYNSPRVLGEDDTQPSSGDISLSSRWWSKVFCWGRPFCSHRPHFSSPTSMHFDHSRVTCWLVIGWEAGLCVSGDRVKDLWVLCHVFTLSSVQHV
jgi:hypothetical protein